MGKQQQKPDQKQQAMQIANQQMAEIKRRIEMKTEQIRGLLGDVAHAERLMMGSLMIIADNPKLRACDPASIVRSVLQAALVGAEAIAGLGEGYFVPYFNKDLGVAECSFMPGYRLAQRKIQEATGLRVIADAVCEKDHWKYSQVPLVLEHTPADGDRGARLRSYAVLLNDDGRVMFAQVASADDIEQAKKSSRKGRDTDSPSWRDWEDRMWRKVAIMRLGKEARAYKTTAQLDAVIEAEAAAFELRRGFIGDIPEPRLLPPGVPEEGRAKVGSSAKPKPEPQKEAPPADAKPATNDQAKEETPASPTDEPSHDPDTGETEEPKPSLCAQPGCDSEATHGVYCGGHKPAERAQARMDGAGF